MDRDAPFAPLTPRQKFTVATLRTTRGSVFLLSGLQAGFSQAIDRPEGFGQGADGYGRRYGAALANNLSFDFFGRFAFPGLLHQDPRYFRAGSGSAGSRLKYSVSRTFVTRTDSGDETFNSSQVLGSLFSSALANAYYPEEDRDAAGTFSRAGARLAWAAAGNVLREFWPEIRRKLRRGNKPAASLAGPSSRIPTSP
ncbi:MAG TPA: hypothetical protein VNK82_08045 [Terriglobales bacterium]|nr:hypothetical protein [Terriglobales bacterium]